MGDSDNESIFGGAHEPRRCRIIGSYIQNKYKTFHEAIVDLCAENTFWYGIHPGVTFIVPSEKVRKQIEGDVYTNSPASMMVFRSYLFNVPLPDAASFGKHNPLLDSRHHPHQVAVSGTKVTVDGVELEKADDFKSSDANVCLWKVKGTGEFKVNTERVERPKKPSPKQDRSNSLHGDKFVAKASDLRRTGGKKSPHLHSTIEVHPEDIGLDQLRRAKLVKAIVETSNGDKNKLLEHSISFFNYLNEYHHSEYETVMRLVNMHYPIVSMMAAIVSPVVSYTSLFGDPRKKGSQHSRDVGWQMATTLDQSQPLSAQLQEHINTNLKLNRKVQFTVYEGDEQLTDMLSKYDAKYDSKADEKLSMDFAMFELNNAMQQRDDLVVAFAEDLALNNSFKSSTLYHELMHMPNPTAAMKHLNTFAQSVFLAASPANGNTELQDVPDKDTDGSLRVIQHDFKKRGDTKNSPKSNDPKQNEPALPAVVPAEDTEDEDNWGISVSNSRNII